MEAGGHRLGIDFGTSNTVAVARWPDGRVRPLLFDGAPLLPSSVIVDERGTLTAGREALHAARIRPEYFEPNPKRRIDDGTVLLGEHEIPVRDLIAAVLRRVAEEAERVLAARPEVVLTHPATWGARRCQVLRDAAERAGLGKPALVAEPVAAGSYFVRVHGARLPAGSVAVVYDLGAGTFDASVLRRTGTGFDVLACEGLPDAGGLDIDAALVAFLGAVYGNRNGALWHRLERPTSTADRRASRLLWDDVRGAKEALSRTSSSTVLIPLLDEDAPLGREQLERLARPILDRTVAATANALRIAGVRQADLACVFLVGGASRIPLAATLLHTTLAVAPTVIEQPEIVVAEGSLHASPAAWSPAAPADTTPAPFWTAGAVPLAPVSVPPVSGYPVSGGPASGYPVSGGPVSGGPVSGGPVSSGPMPGGPDTGAGPAVFDRGPVSFPPGPASPGPASPGPVTDASPVSVPPIPGSVPVSGPPGPVSGTAPVVGPPVGPPVAPASVSPPPGPVSPRYIRAILTGVGVVLTFLIIASTDRAPATFEYGLRTIFDTSPVILLLLAQVLAVAALAVRGQLVDPGHDPLGSAGRFAGLLVLGHGVGMGIGLSQYDGDLYDAEMVTAMLGGLGVAAAGFASIVSVLVDRVRPPGRWHRYGVPLLLGLGSGMILLLTQVSPFNVAFFMIFQSDQSSALDLGRYLGFTVGAAIAPIVTAVVAALIGRLSGGRAAGKAAQRVVTTLAALALVVGGVTATAEAANLLG